MKYLNLVCEMLIRKQFRIGQKKRGAIAPLRAAFPLCLLANGQCQGAGANVAANAQRERVFLYVHGREGFIHFIAPAGVTRPPFLKYFKVSSVI